MVDPAAEALPDEPRRLALRLDRIRIEGFKVYNFATNVGPLQPFNCIIGPNGIGKSVLGEAIAFALGATARMLRVKTLAGVISTSLGEDGRPLSTAEVTLSFLVIDPLNQRIAGQLHVRRQVTRSNRSTFQIAVCLCPSRKTDDDPTILVQNEDRINTGNDIDDSQSVLDDLKDSTRTNDDDYDSTDEDVNSLEDAYWHDTTHANLAIMLNKYGLDISALERVIVTQHRRAVDVADPKKLVKFIEQLIGGAGAQRQLEVLTAEYATSRAEEDRLDDQYDALVTRSEHLNPALQQWKRFNENKLEYQERVATVCRKRAVLLENEAELAGEEAEKAEKRLESIETTQETARIKADELLLVKEKADNNATAAVTGHNEVISQHQTALEELQRAKAREKSALSTCKRAETTLSSTIAISGNNTNNNQNNKKKMKMVTAGKVKEELSTKSTKLENEVADVQDEMDVLEKQIAQLKKHSVNNNENLSLEVQQARASWKDAQEKANVAAATTQVAAKKSSEATEAVSIAASTLKTQEKAVFNAEKAVEKCNSSISSLETELLAVENERKRAGAEAEQAEKHLASHQIKGMKLKFALEKSLQALRAAGIDETEAGYTEFQSEFLKNGAGGSSGGSKEHSRQSINAAVAALAQHAQHDELNPLTGAFHGRMHSVLRLITPQVSNAANAVLLEKCNPAAALVTSTRTAAEAVVSYFKDHKVGIVACNVLEELRGSTSGINNYRDKAASSRGMKATSATTAAAAELLLAPVLNKTPGAMCPLSMLIQTNENVAGSSLLLSDLFENWYLVSDPISAAKIMDQDRKEEKLAAAAAGETQQKKNSKTNQKKNSAPIVQKQQYRRNLVTLCGSLFKCDGEICAAKEDAFLKMKEKYLLRSAFVEVGSAESLNSSSAFFNSSKEIEEMVEKLRAEHAQALAAIEDHELATNAIEERASAAHAALASAQEAVSSMKHKIEVALKTLQKETKVVNSAQAALEKARQRHQAAASKAEKLLAVSLESEVVATQYADHINQLYKAYVDAAKGEPAAQKAILSEQALIDLLSRCDAAENRRSILETELSSVQTELQRLNNTMNALDAAEKAVSDTKSYVHKATLGVAAVEEQLQQAENAVENATAAKSEATKSWREAVKLHQAALQAHQETLATIHDARTRQRTALATAVDMGNESVAALEQVNLINAKINRVGVALSSIPPRKEKENEGKIHKKANKAADYDDLMSEDDDGYCNSTSSSDVEFEQVAPKRSRRSSANPAGATEPAEKQLDEADPMETQIDHDDDSEWEEEEVTRAMAELSQQKRALEALALALDNDAVKEALQIHSQLIQVQTALQEQESKVQKLSLQLAEARTARYTRFSTAMDAAAKHLSTIYQTLTGKIGDALCRYEKDENAAFEQGVKFLVRPDNGTWRTFASLSGGQQALAALSLCFALQKVAPSPFYFFDEIDAALDTINSQRVADFLRDLCEAPYSIKGGMAPQIIAVSHRVAPQDKAHCLLAVYPISTSDTNGYNSSDNNLIKQKQGQQQQTGIMTLYPSAYAGNNTYVLQCQETGRQQFLSFNDNAGNGAWEEILQQQGYNNYLAAMVHMMYNLPYEMECSDDEEGEGEVRQQ